MLEAWPSTISRANELHVVVRDCREHASTPAVVYLRQAVLEVWCSADVLAGA